MKTCLPAITPPAAIRLHIIVKYFTNSQSACLFKTGNNFPTDPTVPIKYQIN